MLPFGRTASTRSETTDKIASENKFSPLDATNSLPVIILPSELS